MAFDCVIKIDGVKGESQVKGHEGELDVLSYSWGASNNSPAVKVLGGSGAGKTKLGQIHDLRFRKPSDKATPQLMGLSFQPKDKVKAVLVCRKSGGGPKPLDYMTITLEDVIVAHISTGTKGTPDETPEDEVTLNFSKGRIEYKEQNEKGQTGDSITVEFDIGG